MVITTQPFLDLFYRTSTCKSMNKVADQKNNRDSFSTLATSRLILYYQHNLSFCFYKHVGITTDNSIYLIRGNWLPIFANMQTLTVNHFRYLFCSRPSILTCKAVKYGFFNFHNSFQIHSKIPFKYTKYF